MARARNLIKIESILKKYFENLQKDNIEVDRLVVFGSYAKGKEKPWSDLDVCVVSRQFGENNFDHGVHLMKLTPDNIEPYIEPHPYHPKDLAEKWDPLAHEIRKYGKAFKIEKGKLVPTSVL